MAGVAQTGGMIALIPTEGDAGRLAVDHDGAESPGELHMTLAYLGEDVTDMDDGDRARLLEAVRSVAASMPPLAGDVMSHSIFNPNGDHDRDPCAVYLTVGPRLPQVREALAEHDVSEHPMWLPHITAGYGLPTDALSYTGPVTFDRLRVALAGEHTDIPLTGPDIEPPAGPDPDDTEQKGDRVDGEDDDVEVKAKVASEAGEKRYGLKIGTELGQARNAQAADAQKNPRAKDQYETLVNANPRDYRKMLDDLSAADLKSLAAIAYSFKSSNPTVVQARIALAGALKRKGLDVNDYGGLGKSGTSGGKGKGKTATPRSRTKAKGSGSSTASRAGINAAVPGGKVDANKITDGQRARLLAAGWKGDPNDGSETLYAPGTHKPVKKKDAVGDDENTEVQDIDPADIDWSFLADAVEAEGDDAMGPDGDPDDEPDELLEGKARTTTKPWETRKAQRGGKTIGADKSTEKGGGDEYPVKTIGDIAAGVKRAKAIKDPDRKAEVMAHLRKGAKAIGGPAVNMVPKDGADDSGGGKGKGGFVPFKKGHGKKDASSWGALLTGDDDELAAAIEAKVMSPAPSATRLREYWAHGEGRAKWSPGTPGDFERLKRAVRKYVPAHMLNGFVANVHKLATGEWPGKNAHGGKTGEPEGLEAKGMGGMGGMVTLSKDDLSQFDGFDNDDDDSVNLALDRYADMDDEVTSEDAYEQALADEVDWTLEPDGTLSGGDDGDGEDDDDGDSDDGPDGDGDADDGVDEDDEESVRRGLGTLGALLGVD